MQQVAFVPTFDAWRIAARTLLTAGTEPGDIIWTAGSQGTLFGSEHPSSDGVASNVPAEFVALAKTVACYDSPERWPLLYRLLFRITKENRELLSIESDRDVRDARLMEKAIRRDVHKFHAFVRFREIASGEGEEIFAAWHEPQHFTVEKATPFFARRFGAMRFSIFTPKGCAHWDRKELTFTEPAERKSAPDGDEMEDLWRLYYSSIFNPFRLNVDTMKRELPMRHWRTLPEASLIPGLIWSAAGASAGSPKAERNNGGDGS